MTQPQQGPHFGSVDEFVREYLCPTFARPVGSRTGRFWSAEWWKSQEATVRLDALWRSWESAIRDPNDGMSMWLRDHADYHMNVLFSADGPFGRSRDETGPGEPLPYSPPPPGMFPDLRGR